MGWKISLKVATRGDTENSSFLPNHLHNLQLHNLLLRKSYFHLMAPTSSSGIGLRLAATRSSSDVRRWMRKMQLQSRATHLTSNFQRGKGKFVPIFWRRKKNGIALSFPRIDFSSKGLSPGSAFSSILAIKCFCQEFSN